MKKPTKKEQAREAIFAEQIAPLMDKITDLCDENNMPLLIAVQIYTSKTNGARIAAQAIDTKNAVLPLQLSSKILRGQARVTLETDTSLYVTLADENGDYADDFDDDGLESLTEHAEHCDECREHMKQRLAAGEDISDIRVVNGGHNGEHNEHNEHNDESSLLGIKSPFIVNKSSKIIH